MSDNTIRFPPIHETSRSRSLSANGINCDRKDNMPSARQSLITCSSSSSFLWRPQSPTFMTTVPTENNIAPLEDDIFALLSEINEEDDLLEFEEAKTLMEEALQKYKDRHDELVNILQTYLTNIKGKTDEDGEKLINFDQYEQKLNKLISNLSNDHSDDSRKNILFTTSELANQVLSDTKLSYEEAIQNVSQDEPLNIALEKIRKLDFVLKEKTEQEQQLSKLVKEIVKKDKLEKDDTLLDVEVEYPILTKQEQRRVEEILKDTTFEVS